MNKTTLIIVAVVVVSLLALTAYLSRDGAKMWQDTQISCLINGHTNLKQHIHPEFSITVDGVPETLPANIGVTDDCMAEIHTHDATGMVHIETVHPKTFVLADFYAVSGTALERPGYNVSVSSNATPVQDPLTMQLADHQKIEIVYTTAP